MAAFDPDAYLAKPFNPDEYLSSKKPSEIPGPRTTWEKVRPYVAPTVEALGAAGGGLIGAPLGLPGAVGGAGLGYGAAKEALQLADQYLGNAKPRAGMQAIIEPIQNVGEGMAWELAGPALNAMRSATVGGSKNLLSSITGNLTGKGAPSIQEAYKAGKAGEQQFIENLRGQRSPDEVLSSIKQGLNDMQTATSQAYASAKTGWAANKTPLDFQPVEKKLNDVVASMQQGGKWKIGTAERTKIDEIAQVVDEWKNDPAARTALDFDALKQRIDAIYPDSPLHGQVRRAVTEIRNAVKDQIVKQAPDYADAMKSYETQLTLMRDISKALGSGDKVAKETAINKVMSLLKESPSAEFRRDLVARLKQQTGVDVMAAAAGQNLSQLAPSSGFGKAVMGGGLTAATMLHHPAFLAALPLTSPRLMGEAAYGLGRTSAGMNALRSNIPVPPLGTRGAVLNALTPSEQQ